MSKTFYLSIALSSFLLITDLTYAEGSWAIIEGHSLTMIENQVDVSIATGGEIPVDGSSGAIGYGVITGTNDDGYPENVLALTSHKCVADSLVQAATGDCDNTVGLLNALFSIPDENHNDATWHAHFLDLMPITEESDCFNVTNKIGLEVDLARTLATQNNVSPDNEVTLDGSNISVSGLRLGDFHNSAFKKVMVVSFGIVGFADANGAVTNLCLTLADE